MRHILGVGLLLFWGYSALAYHFKDLEKDVKASKSIEEFLPKLSEDLRSRYTLVRNGRGRQPATPDKPRAILFGNTGHLIVGFNADSDFLELASFDNETGTLDFYEINFSEKGGELSPPNPEQCMDCHDVGGTKYNWDPYPEWTGMFGQNDDYLIPIETDPEYADFRKFEQSARTHKRYQALVLHPVTAVTEGPYYLYFKDRATTHFDMPGRTMHHQPNLYLTKVLTRNTAKILHARLKKSPLYEEWKYFLAISLLTCSRYPKDPRMEKVWKHFTQFHKKRYPKPELKLQMQPMGPRRDEVRGEVSRILGVEPESWNLKLHPHRTGVDFRDGASGLYQFVSNEVWSELIPKHPERESLWRYLQHPLTVKYADKKQEWDLYQVLDELGIALSGPYAHSDGHNMDQACDWLLDESVRSFGL